MLAGRRSSTLNVNTSTTKSGQPNAAVSPSIKYSDGTNREATEETLLKLLDNKSKHVFNAVKFQMTSFEMFQAYGELFRNNLKESANTAITLSKLYTTYNDTLTNESEPLITLASKKITEKHSQNNNYHSNISQKSLIIIWNH